MWRKGHSLIKAKMAETGPRRQETGEHGSYTLAR